MDTEGDGPEACIHRWRLGAPEGDRVVGRCKHCDAVRVYPAVGAEWEVPAERGEGIAFADRDRFREGAAEIMRWSA